MYETALKRFEKYINDNFDKNNEIISRKLEHTYNVIKMSEYISNDLKLSEEDKCLAKLIALLHDIGRFEQARGFSNLLEASKKHDHAVLGIQLLFEKGLIREFIKDIRFDNIIKKAIFNHNKYILDTMDLSSREELHCKIIRDADKIDNYRVKSTRNVTSMSGITKEGIEKSLITEKIYNTFMLQKTILKEDRKTDIDIWISYIAFIFDLNYLSSLVYIKNNNYINILIDRFDYKNENTKKQMQEIRNFAIKYIDEKIKESTSK